VWIRLGDTAARLYPVEHCRGYRDRLVLKLDGIDDPGAAEALRGGEVMARCEQAPALPPGQYWVARLIGLEVVDENHGTLGRIEGVLPTGGTDVLIIASEEGRTRSEGVDELLVPLAPEIVREVDEENGTVRVCLPDGLLELNRRDTGPGRAER
jgi:16S rRNA processing protein RimM